MATLTEDNPGEDTASTIVNFVNNVSPITVLDPVAVINVDGAATVNGTISEPDTIDTNATVGQTLYEGWQSATTNRAGGLRKASMKGPGC